MSRADVLKADLTVIGGGPGGCAAAIRGAELGGDVVLVEAARLGGVCVNVGCIPSKVLLHHAGLLHQMRWAGEFDLWVGEAGPDLKRLMIRKQVVVDGMVEELERLLGERGVRVIRGRGRLVSKGLVEVDSAGDQIRIGCSSVVVATGSRPASLPIRGIDLAVTTERLVEMEEPPRRVVMLGGGPEGVEFASALNDLGVKVTVVEMLDALLPLEDREIGRRLETLLRGRGVEFRIGATILGLSEEKGVKTVSICGPKGEERLEADMIVLAAGRQSNTENLGLDALSITFHDGWISVDERMETDAESVYAVGDVVGGGLAHVASEQGAVAAENALGRESRYDGRIVPRCFYTRPEIAAVGLTEEEARTKGFQVKIGRSEMGENDRSTILGEEAGFAKVLVDAANDRILGVHLMGACVSEIISEASLAMRLGVTAQDIARNVHPYPTVSEALREAARSVEA